MKKLIFILTVLLIASCQPEKEFSMSVEEVDLKLTEEWVYAEALEGLKYNNEVLSRPPGVEQLVMSLTLPSVGGLSRKKHCLYYQVPYKEKAGRLRVQEIKIADECPETSSEDIFFVTLSEIKNLKVSYENYKVSLNFESQKGPKSIVIPLPNVEMGLVHEKYNSLKEKRLTSGMRLLRLNEDSFDFASNKYLGKLADRFSKGSAIRCHQVDKKCQTIGENRCDDCRYGWYEVVNFQCPQGSTKFCGQNHCGEKNEPACPRGTKVVEPEDAGICQSDLEPVLNADKILVCQ